MITAKGKIARIEVLDKKSGKGSYRRIRLLDDEMRVHDVLCFEDKATFVKGQEIEIELNEDTEGVYKSTVASGGKK